MRILSLIIIIFTFISCGENSLTELVNPDAISIQAVSGGEVAEELPYRYNFRGEDCETGQQLEPTFLNICEALKDEKRNKECAQDKRENMFLQSNCSGSFS